MLRIWGRESLGDKPTAGGHDKRAVPLAGRITDVEVVKVKRILQVLDLGKPIPGAAIETAW